MSLNKLLFYLVGMTAIWLLATPLLLYFYIQYLNWLPL